MNYLTLGPESFFDKNFILNFCYSYIIVLSLHYIIRNYIFIDKNA